MAQTTVRIDERTRDVVRELAAETHQSMQALLAAAVEAYRRRLILEQHNAAYAALRADPVAWHEELGERALWEGTLMDDLEDDAYEDERISRDR